MLPLAQRALIIGLVGPAIQALGVLWLLAHLLLLHTHDPVDPRHFFFEGGFLTFGAGLLITLVCVPVAIEVARASEAEVALTEFELEEQAPAPSFNQRRHAGASK
jgi:hypothetical protein